MRKRLVHGPLLLLLYQAAPVGVREDSTGRYRVTVGFGGGRWENEEFDCQGALVSATKVPFTTGGAVAEAWPTPQMRFTAFGGRYRATPPMDSTGQRVHDYNGPFGGGQLAYEGRRFGIGLGLAYVSGFDGFTAPSGYVRVGDLDGVHTRTDLFAPTTALGTTGWFRGGIGYRMGARRRIGGFLGVAVGPTYSEKALYTGTLRVPIGRRLELHLDGIAGPGERYSQQGGAVGLQYDFGSFNP